MFKNLKITTLLKSTGDIIFLMLIISNAISYYDFKKVSVLIEEKRTEILPNVFSFKNLKLDVVQVQQWLTDISATRAQEGYDDGFDEAKKYFDDGNKILDHLIKEHKRYKKPEMVHDLEAFKSAFAKYYAVGIEMANAYIQHGHEEGNKLMSELDPWA